MTQTYQILTSPPAPCPAVRSQKTARHARQGHVETQQGHAGLTNRVKTPNILSTPIGHNYHPIYATIQKKAYLANRINIIPTTVTDDNMIAQLTRPMLQSLQYISPKTVRTVRPYHPNGVGLLANQATSHHILAIPQLLSGIYDPPTSLETHLGVTIQRTIDGGITYPYQLGKLLLCYCLLHIHDPQNKNLITAILYE
jgi:hypothetical protein